jgi:hypothetical protein
MCDVDSKTAMYSEDGWVVNQVEHILERIAYHEFSGCGENNHVDVFAFQVKDILKLNFLKAGALLQENRIIYDNVLFLNGVGGARHGSEIVQADLDRGVKIFFVEWFDEVCAGMNFLGARYGSRVGVCGEENEG